MPDARGGSHVNDWFVFMKPKFHVVDKAKHERGTFGMQIPRLVRHDPCPWHGVQDGQQPYFGLFGGVLIAQGMDEVLLIGAIGRGDAIGRRGAWRG